jgi:hypothetical protein
MKMVSARWAGLFLGRLWRATFLLFLGVVLYTILLSLFLRFGPAGAGARICQLGLAVILPAASVYRFTFRRRKSLACLRKPALALAMGGTLTPGFLSPVPAISLAATAALAGAPYYLPGRNWRKWGLRIPRSGLEESCTSLGILGARRRTYYFRQCGPLCAESKGYKVIRRGDLAYMKLSRVGLSGGRSRERALRAAGEVARAKGVVLVPATSSETLRLSAGDELDEEALRILRKEQASLAPLSVAIRRTLRCSRGDSSPLVAHTADVVIARAGDLYQVRILSAPPAHMGPQRLRDLLDLYGMVATGRGDRWAGGDLDS